MRNKGFILVLTVVVSVLCLYYLSFSLVSKGVEEDATRFATTKTGQVDHYKKQSYLDSVWKAPVFNFLGAEYTYQEIKESELSLGLDLKGGMHVTLEVSPVEIIKAMAGGRKDAAFEQAIARAQKLQTTSQENFVDLFYRSYRELQPNGKLASIFANSTTRNLSYNSTDKEVLAAINKEVDDAVARSFNILRTRIDKFGVNQPNIQHLKGTNRIQIELPGVDNPERVRKLLQGTANLEFWEVWSVQEYGPYFTQLNDYLVKQEAASKLKGAAAPSASLASAADTTANALAAAAAKDTSALAAQLSKPADSAAAQKDSSINPNQSSLLARLFTTLPGGLGTNVRDTAKVNALFAKPEVRALFPQNMKFLWGVQPIVANDGAEFLELYAIKKGRDGKAPLSGENISDARQDYDQTGRPEINMSMNAAGSKKWQRLTGDNIGRQVAIVLDDYVYSAPVVQSEISGGNSSISGSFTIEEAQDLANILKAGKMPAPTRIVEEAIVGPSLGQEAINQGLISSLAGMGLVVLFMFAYYNKGGLIANIALFFNIFFIIGILAQFGTALTLPGIAGMVLTMGMSVDANVLIFERIKEELASGMGVQDAIKKGYSKAFSSIFDSNVTTLLAGTILYFFGSGPVKGFAITLMIGIATSFFTAVFVSRLLVEWLTAGKNANNLSLETGLSRNWFKNIKFDILGNRKKAYIFSAIFILFGIVAVFIKGGLPLGVDFKGGRSYVVNFDTPVPASEVRSALDDEFKGAGTEVKTYGAANRLKVTTSYIAEDESTQADESVRAALDQGLSQYKNLNPTVVSSSKVGATMADDIQKTAVIAVLLAFAGIFLYLAFRFSRWQYSLGGVVALIHDVLVVFSAFTIANLFGISFEMDQVFIASILTIIGYSINDTVVVFDRIREYTNENPRVKFRDIVNPALNSTFGRTIITNLTVLLVVVVLFIFGGETLRGFSFAMLIGSLTGTYSTLFIAAPIVVDTTNVDKERIVTAKPVVAGS
ncbi:protein translocase subunit SecDF [Rufibacter glacialis]|uniref:Multifunctional fusion protein n=1 Tax=Rufibacter glacialis TaxID=1259555 RepID=A0A5M8QN19_9BACT|nr:protein translocase subunit SecDF [Rufibacter glacialis]KAA6437535.1 protein translocase subunit SecDF [Rufibacter glacialis]GGK58515.1 protein translocase subunit SecDF [Rufibacter glacialis]